MEKGGLSATLKETGTRRGAVVAFADEVRVGLHGQTRRVWAPRGMKVRQRVQVRYEWRYLAVAVEPASGRLRWRWQRTMQGAAVAEVVRAWREAGVESVVWDGAGGHWSGEVKAAGVRLVKQPAYSPELNPAERVGEEVRRAIEGEVYGTLEEKMAAAERRLTELTADPGTVKSLCGWEWIMHALASLPQNTAPA